MRRECREPFPRRRLLRKPLVSDPGMHHGTCRDACQGRLPAVVGKTIPAFPANAQPAIWRIWQEAHNRRRKISNISQLPSTKYTWRDIYYKCLPSNRCCFKVTLLMCILLYAFISISINKNVLYSPMDDPVTFYNTLAAISYWFCFRI